LPPVNPHQKNTQKNAWRPEFSRIFSLAMKKTPKYFCAFDLTFFFSFSSALLHGPIFLFDSLKAFK